MTASDLRFAIRNKQWHIVDVAAGTTVAGPFATVGEAIQARQDMATVDTTAQMDTQRRRAAAWQKQLASTVNADES